MVTVDVDTTQKCLTIKQTLWVLLSDPSVFATILKASVVSRQGGIMGLAGAVMVLMKHDKLGPLISEVLSRNPQVSPKRLNAENTVI